MSAQPWSRRRRERYDRRLLTKDSRRYGGAGEPRWRWLLFQALLWLSWRARWYPVTRVAGFVCIGRWMGWDFDTSWWPWR